jgi:hypothetical protein
MAEIQPDLRGDVAGESQSNGSSDRLAEVVLKPHDDN